MPLPAIRPHRRSPPVQPPLIDDVGRARSSGSPRRRRSSVFVKTRCGSDASFAASSNSRPASRTAVPPTRTCRDRRSTTTRGAPPRPLFASRCTRRENGDPQIPGLASTRSCSSCPSCPHCPRGLRRRVGRITGPGHRAIEGRIRDSSASRRRHEADSLYLLPERARWHQHVVRRSRLSRRRLTPRCSNRGGLSGR